MKSKQIVLTLGYVAIFCVALYLVFGLLKISGHGLSSMTGEPLIEGFKPAQIDKSSEVLEKNIEQMKTMPFLKNMANWDDASEYNEYKEQLLELAKLQREQAKYSLHNMIISNLNAKKPKTPNFSDKVYGPNIDKLLRVHNLVKFLEEDPDYDV